MSDDELGERKTNKTFYLKLKNLVKIEEKAKAEGMNLTKYVNKIIEDLK